MPEKTTDNWWAEELRMLGLVAVAVAIGGIAYMQHHKLAWTGVVHEIELGGSVAVGVILLLIAVYGIVRYHYRSLVRRGIAWSRILLSRDDVASPLEIIAWFDSLAGVLRHPYWAGLTGTVPLGLTVLRASDGEVQFWLSSRADLLSTVEARLRGVYTSLRFRRRQEPALPTLPVLAVLSPRRSTVDHGWRQYRDYTHSIAESVAQVLDGMTAPAVVQIILNPLGDHDAQKLRQARDQAELAQKQAAQFAASDQAQLQALVKSAGRSWWRTEIRLGAANTADLGALTGALNEAAAENSFQYRLILSQLGRNWLMSLLRAGMPGLQINFPSFPMPSIFLATLWQMPSARLRVASLAREPVRRLPAVGAPVPKGQGWVVDEAGREYAVGERDRKSNILVIGQQGTGKSTVLEQIIHSDLSEPQKAVIVVDPKGPLADRARGYLPPDREAAVWRIGWPQNWGLNPFLAPIDPYLAIDDLLSNMLAIWGPEAIGPRSQEILRNVYLAVYSLGWRRDGLVAAANLLRRWPEWGRVATALPEGPARDWFTSTWQAWTDNPRLAGEATAAPGNKLGALLFAPAMRQALAPAQTLDIGRLIRDRGVLIVSLSGADVGDENASLMGVILLSTIWQALRREGLASPATTSIILDEAHRLICPSFTKLLAEGRSFGAQSTVAFQFWRQIHDAELQASLRELLQNLFLFRTSQIDEALQTSQLLARVYGNLLSPTDEAQDKLNLGPDDIVNTPNYRVWVRLVSNGNPQPPFLGATMPLEPAADRDTMRPWGSCPDKWLRGEADLTGEGDW